VNTSDVAQYLGEFNVARQRFAEMGVTYSEQEAVYQTIEGLPTTPSWDHFKQILLELVESITDRESREDIPTPSLLYATIAQRITSECTCLVTLRLESNPGSEYAHFSREIRKHTANPLGVLCTNPRCSGKSAEDHDWDHCWAKGGGAEGQGPRRPRMMETTAGAPRETTSLVTEYTTFPDIDVELEC
jgi:hypothetical protein